MNQLKKIITHISRFLLGLIFLVFGLNGFLHFIPMPPPSGVAGQFLGAMFVVLKKDDLLLGSSTPKFQFFPPDRSLNLNPAWSWVC